MAHHKSAKKRIKTSEKRRLLNKSTLTKMKNIVKKVYNAETKDEADGLLKQAVSYLDKTSSKGVIHKNNAARKKSSLTKHVNSLKA